MQKLSKPFNWDVLALRATSYCPPIASHYIGASAGHLGHWWGQHTQGKRQRIGATNIALCFPEKSSKERATLLQKNWLEMGKSLFETPYYWQRASADQIRHVIQAEPAKALLDAAFEQNKGLIVAAPHLGSWEILGLWLSMEYGITSLYRPQKGALETEILAARERFGANLVPTDTHGVRTLLAALKHNQMIGILPDQDPPRASGVFVQFFGALANTTTLLPKLAQRSKAPVFIVWLERKNRGYKLHCQTADNGIYANDITTATTAMNRTIEHCVSQRPEQYWWTYPRFRRLPNGEHRQY